MLKRILVAFFVFLLVQTVAFAKPKMPIYNVIQPSDGIYVIEVNENANKKAPKEIVPYVVDEVKTNFEVYKEIDPLFVVNAGFFDMKNKKTVSYVVIDGETVLNPEENDNLMHNFNLKPYLDKILNRSEFRILENEEGKILYDIASHKDEVQEGYKIKHSIQCGPMLMPELRLEEEFFILVRDGKIVSESASSLHKYARTAIGIRENKVYIFIVTKEAPMTLEELANLTRVWGMEKAMAFDGGGSTSFDSKELHVVSEKDNTGRKVKSFLILK